MCFTLHKESGSTYKIRLHLSVLSVNIIWHYTDMSGLWNKILKSRKGSHRAKWVIHVTGSVEKKLDLCIIRLSETNRPTSHLQKRYFRLQNFTTQVIKIWIQLSNSNSHQSLHGAFHFVTFGNCIRSCTYGVMIEHLHVFQFLSHSDSHKTYCT